MTPPPTMTTWDRGGRSATGDHLVEEAPQAAAAEGRRRLLVALHPEGVEVVVDRAGGFLDEAPQGPAVLAAERLHPYPGTVGGRRVAEVHLAPRVDLVLGEVALG